MLINTGILFTKLPESAVNSYFRGIQQEAESLIRKQSSLRRKKGAGTQERGQRVLNKLQVTGCKLLIKSCILQVRACMSWALKGSYNGLLRE